MAASPQPIAATRKASVTAGPVWLAATVPVSTKTPLPIMDPRPIEVSVRASSTRFSRGPVSSSRLIVATDLRAASCFSTWDSPVLRVGPVSHRVAAIGSPATGCRIIDPCPRPAMNQTTRSRRDRYRAPIGCCPGSCSSANTRDRSPGPRPWIACASSCRPGSPASSTLRKSVNFRRTKRCCLSRRLGASGWSTCASRFRIMGCRRAASRCRG